MQHKSVKLLILVLMLLALVSISLAACTRPGTAAANSGNNGASPTSAPAPGGTSDVHMGDSNFIQSTITIKKGDSINLIDDSSAPHVIQNGTWNNGSAQANKEAGAPAVQQQFQGNDSHAVGPFTTSGTFQLYCTIHPNMNLTVTVQ